MKFFSFDLNAKGHFLKIAPPIYRNMAVFTRCPFLLLVFTYLFKTALGSSHFGTKKTTFGGSQFVLDRVDTFNRQEGSIDLETDSGGDATCIPTNYRCESLLTDDSLASDLPIGDAPAEETSIKESPPPPKKDPFDLADKLNCEPTPRYNPLHKVKVSQAAKAFC